MSGEQWQGIGSQNGKSTGFFYVLLFNFLVLGFVALKLKIIENK